MTNPFNLITHPYCYSGHQYALDVVSGKIPNCKYIIGACKRYLSDYGKYTEEEFPRYWFDADKAEKYLRVVQKFEHVIGEWDTKNIVYEPWQNFIFMNIMGWQDSMTGYRRFRMAHIEIPRGHGKSCIASQACLYFLAGDDSKGNKISCVATKKDQARIVLDSARAMAEKNDSFCRVKGVQVRAHNILQESTFSEVRALSSDKNGLDGLNDVLAVCDELHAMSGEVFDLITSGMSKRKDSLILCITTAGFNTDSVGYSQSEYAKKVALGDMEDDTFFSIIYTIDKDDDIYDEATWRKANPGYGVMVDPITFAKKADKTKVTPRDLPNFKVKHLNIWINEANSYYDQNKWDDLVIPDLKIEDFYGSKCFVGIDLASKVDLTSIVYVFKKEDKYYLFDRSYIPEESINRNPLYENCVGEGFLISTPGEAIHLPNIQEDFLTLSKKIRIAEAYYDPWNATEFGQRMQQENIQMVEFRMNTASLSEPTKTLDALVRQKRIFHNGSPLLRWCLGNVVCKEDAGGNVFPRKTHEKLKIDPIISLVMALAGWIREEENESVYETRGIRIL